MTFQQQLQSVQFRTFDNNRSLIVGYDEIFAERKVLIFSTPSPLPAVFQFESYDDNYQTLINLGINQVFCTSSDTLLVAPWAEKHSDVIRGLADFEHKFVTLLATEYQIEKPIRDLVQFWQYVVVIDNGNPVQFWNNPIKNNTPWKIIKNPKFKYHNLDASTVIEYLDSSKIK
jgi:peroxiredoxin